MQHAPMRNPPFPSEIKSIGEVIGVWHENRAELVTFIQNLAEARFFEKPSKGWTASEIAEHLYLAQWSLARTIPIVLAGKFGKDRTELKNLEYKTAFEFVSQPRGAQNPVEVGPKGGMTRENALSSLETSMRKLDKNLEGRSVDQLRSRGMDHPFFGPISIFDWLWVMTNHEYSHANALFSKYS
jgi:hypothetical protein